MASDKIQTVTDSTFDELVKGPTPVLVDFWAEWCMPCRRIAPTLDRLAEDYHGRLTIAKMDVESNLDVPSRLGVRNIPMLMLFKGGELVDSVVGADDAGITKMVQKNV
jgi:thioredoxin 1